MAVCTHRLGIPGSQADPLSQQVLSVLEWQGWSGRVTTNLSQNVYRPPILAEPSPFGFVERFSGSCCLEVCNAAYVWLTRMVFPTGKSLSKHAETSASGQEQERLGMHQDFQLGYFYHYWIKSAEAESFWVIQSLQLGVCDLLIS